MHEYEFRLVVESSTPFLSLMDSLGYPLQQQIVYYMKPHFRYRNNCFEIKRVESTYAVYHDRIWFRWVHSVEIPYARWSKTSLFNFLHYIGNFQQPFTIEKRHKIVVDSQTQLYTFKTVNQTYRLIFEWEYGTFSKPPTEWNYTELLTSLSRYRNIYQLFTSYSIPPFKLDERMNRQPVIPTTLENLPTGDYLYALKLDGTFGLVFSYEDKIKEKWEGYECVVKPSCLSLGQGFVFAAERLEDNRVYLLDVYQVQGYSTASWCRKTIITEFLPGLSLPEGYFVQKYVLKLSSLDSNPSFKTDGLIAHDMQQDIIFKIKTHHSIDVVYSQGYFYLPKSRIRSSEENLEEGRVYEIATKDGRVLRQRKDRFKGNTEAQLDKIFQHGWYGPPIEPLPHSIKKKKK